MGAIAPQSKASYVTSGDRGSLLGCEFAQRLQWSFLER